MSDRRLAIAALALGLSSAPLGIADAHEVALSRYNYHDHVRPLFLKHCGGCHHQGGSAPMSLLDYQEAVPWANAIKLQVLEGRMPPFLPDEETGPFLHRRGLTAEEIDVIVDWTVGATPEGHPSPAADEDSPRVGASPWSEGTPDLVLEPRESVVLGEEESEKTACVVLPTGLGRSRALARLEIVPGAPTVVRRATVFAGESCAQGEPLLTWLPDEKRVSYPDGLGRELPIQANVALELRYKKGWGQEGKRILDKSAVGLWFAESGVERVSSLRIEGRQTLGRDVTLVGLFPDPVSSAPGEAEPLRVEAVLPGGKTEVLLSIADPDRAWIETYFLREPLVLPQGTELRSSRAAVWADVVFTPASSLDDGARPPRERVPFE
jgi:mono/diheme cytochrome c family protein